MVKFIPTDYYRERIVEHKETLKHITRKSSMFLYGKLLFFFLAVSSCVVWVNYSKSDLVWLYGVICFMTYLILMYLDGKEMDKQRLIQKQIVIFSNEISNLYGEFTNNDGTKYVSTNHPYTFDIDIFGESSLFHRVNRTITQEGADELAKILSNVGVEKDLILQRQAAISELEKLNDFRLSFQCIGKRKKNQLNDRIIALGSANLNVNILKWLVRISWFITAASFLLLITCSLLDILVKTALMTLMIVIFINGIMSVFFFYRSGKIMNRINSLIVPVGGIKLAHI